MANNPQTSGKVLNPRAFAEAQRKPAPRKGVVATMSIEAFCYYLQIHGLRVLGWDGGVVVVEKLPAQKGSA